MALCKLDLSFKNNLIEKLPCTPTPVAIINGYVPRCLMILVTFSKQRDAVSSLCSRLLIRRCSYLTIMASVFLDCR